MGNIRWEVSEPQLKKPFKLLGLGEPIHWESSDLMPFTLVASGQNAQIIGFRPLALPRVVDLRTMRAPLDGRAMSRSSRNP